MRKFQRHRTLSELKAVCKAKRWTVETDRYDKFGDDHVVVKFTVKTLGGPVRGYFLFNTINGRFFGKLRSGEEFDSQKCDHETKRWFQILLETCHTNEPKVLRVSKTQ